VSWSDVREKLPARAWTILNRDGRMILDPVRSREIAERMAGENVGGSLRKALKHGYRVVEVEIRLANQVSKRTCNHANI